MLNWNLFLCWFWQLFLKYNFFLAKKSMRSYVGLNQKFLYKNLSLLLTPTPPNILLTPPPMQWRLCLVQVAQCSVLLKKLHPSVVFSAHFSNALPMQLLDNLRGHINPKWHAADFHTKPFFSLLRPFSGRISIVPRGSQSSVNRGQMKAYLTKILPLLHQISIIWTPHHLPQGTLFRLELWTPPIG